MNKRLKKITQETIARWRDSLLQTGRADVEGAKKLLSKAYPKAQIFVVDTPAQFFIAQGVIRRRVAKKYAKSVLCPLFGIDNGFVDGLRATGRPLEIVHGKTWERRSSNTITDRIIAASMEMACNNVISDDSNLAGTNEAVRNMRAMRQHWRSNRDSDNKMAIRLSHMNPNPERLYGAFMTAIPEIAGATNKSQAAHAMNFSSYAVDNACMSISNVLSDNLVDIVADDGKMYDPQLHMFDATQAEIMCRMLGCKDPNIQITYEIFHYVPAIMKFNGAFLILGSRPDIHVDAEDQLHNDKGMAVNYGDGTGFWFLEGRQLVSQGKKIVLAPETLTGTEIAGISNEEEKRLAIDRFGWEKYMKMIDAKVIDRRENWIDNTVELLIKLPDLRPSGAGGWWRPEPLRAVLACRSTGRRYFIAVPATENGGRDGKKIKTCAQVQDWMANGAHNEHLNYAKLPVRVIGAS